MQRVGDLVIVWTPKPILHRRIWMVVCHATPATLARVYLPRSKFKDKAEYDPLITGFYYQPPCNFSLRVILAPAHVDLHVSTLAPEVGSPLLCTNTKLMSIYTYIRTKNISVSVTCSCFMPLLYAKYMFF